MIYIDVVGYLALVTNLYSMTRADVFLLSVYSFIANFIYIIYGVLISAYPIIIGCSIAVVLHLYHILNSKKVKSKYEKCNLS